VSLERVLFVLNTTLTLLEEVKEIGEISSRLIPRSRRKERLLLLDTA